MSGAAETTQARAPNLAVRIVQVFVSPAKLFDALREHPVWVDALIVLVVINVATAFLIPEDIQRMLVEQFVPADADPEMVDDLVNQGPIRTSIGPLVFTPLMIALVAGLTILAYNVVLGGEATYRQHFSAATHAYFILTAGGLLVLWLLTMGSETMVLSPALLLPPLGDGFLARFLEAINVFAIWMCIVLGIGMSRVYPGRSAAGGTVYLLSLYVIWTAGVTAVSWALPG